MPTPPPAPHRQQPGFWWWISGFYLLLIYLSLPLTPVVVTRAYELLGRATIDRTVDGLLLIPVGLLSYLLFKKTTSNRWPALLPLLVTVLLAAGLDKAVERIHFLQYALLGFFLSSAMDDPRGNRFFKALFLVLVAGLMDEIIQWFLPNRYWDPRDVAMNVIGGGLGLWLGRFLRPGPLPPSHSRPGD